MKVSSESEMTVRRKDGMSDTRALAIRLDAVAGLPRQARGSHSVLMVSAKYTQKAVRNLNLITIH